MNVIFIGDKLYLPPSCLKTNYASQTQQKGLSEVTMHCSMFVWDSFYHDPTVDLTGGDALYTDRNTSLQPIKEKDCIECFSNLKG